MDTMPNNLPLQLSSFIGREHEIAEIKRLLTTSRLVTLTGAGGSGKTRLALQGVADMLDVYPAGVWFVALAPLSDAALLPLAVAAVFGLRDQGGRPLVDVLTDYLRSKELLLLLDNCEHLKDACAHLTDALLRACPQLSMLATSREALDVEGECVYLVPSLEIPNLSPQLPLETLAQNESIRLFVERATQGHVHFALNDEDAHAVAQICRRLDGIPLAIELADARAKVLSVQQIVARLDDMLGLLTRGNALLLRHQTMYAALDWSYNLLTEPERVLFRRLAVFAGSWDLDAAEQVCATNGALPLRFAEVLDTLAGLVDKSLALVVSHEATARYRLLEPVRQYAHGKLDEAAENRTLYQRHLDYFLKLAEEAEPKLRGHEQMAWLARLETERDNLRAALGWAIDANRTEAALRLAGCLGWFWCLRSDFSEGRSWLERIVALPAVAQHSRLQTDALVAMGLLTWLQTWNSEARPQLEQALAIARAYGDKRNAAEALGYLGLITYLEGNSAEAQAYLEESRTLCETIGDKWGVAYALWRLGWVVADIWKLEGTGNQEHALALYEQSLALFRECGDQYPQSVLLRDMGLQLAEKGEWTRAQMLLREALTLAQHVGSKYEIANTLGSMAGMQQTQPANRVRLLGAATKIFQSIGASVTSQAWVERDLAKLRTHLDDKTFGAAFADGYALTLAQAIAEAHRIMLEPRTSAPSVPASSYPAGLTAREVEVLRLLAMGLTNQEIADQLVLSRRTVHAHLRSIYSKLGVTTRNAATRAALELKLA